MAGRHSPLGSSPHVLRTVHCGLWRESERRATRKRPADYSAQRKAYSFRLLSCLLLLKKRKGTLTQTATNGTKNAAGVCMGVWVWGARCAPTPLPQITNHLPQKCANSALLATGAARPRYAPRDKVEAVADVLGE